MIERVFSRLSALYGASFTRQWAGVDVATMKHTWSHELAGFTQAELERGLEACRNIEFPPSVPQFRNLCRPLLDAEVAYAEAVRLWPSRSGWSHPAIYWAALAIGNDLTAKPYIEIRGRWKEAYRRAQDHPKPLPPAVEAPRLTHMQATPEEREAAFQRVREKYGPWS